MELRRWHVELVGHFRPKVALSDKAPGGRRSTGGENIRSGDGEETGEGMTVSRRSMRSCSTHRNSGRSGLLRQVPRSRDRVLVEVTLSILIPVTSNRARSNSYSRISR